MAITHTFVSGVEDGADATLVRPSNWNAGHSGIVLVSKASDETVNNSSTLQNDDALLFAIGTAGTWAFEIDIYAHGGTTPDIKYTIILPAAATMAWTMYYWNGTVFTENGPTQASGTPVTVPTGAAGEANAYLTKISGWVKSGGTAGNVQLQWAQSTADESDTIVMAESYLIAHRLV